MAPTPSTSSPSTKPCRFRRWALRALLALLLLPLATVGLVWLALRGSLAKLDGTLRLAQLSAPVQIERDALGVPTIVASNRLDLVRAVGFLHGQDRCFQMDLLRRAAAGELSELLGSGTLGLDQSIRPLRLRNVAQKAVALLTPGDQQLLAAYADGVNAGIAALLVRPPEYLLLRQKPQAWRPEDSVLVLHSMGLDLSDAWASQEANLAIARQALPSAAFAFYVRGDSAYPAALDDSRLPAPPMPTAEQFDVRTNTTNQQADAASKDRLVDGSNAWAIGGRRTATGAGMLANDMHLGISLPNTWYRARFVWRDADGTQRRSVGVTLPGTPALVAGSNGRVAWGFTAAQLDVSDQVLLEVDSAHPDACRVGKNWQPFQKFSEEIKVAGGSNVIEQVSWTPWGPVGSNLNGQRVAYCWAMDFPEAANFGLLEFERASTAQELLDHAPACGLPWVNVLVADRDGNVGWTLGGHFPKRVGFEGRTPVSWADGTCRWDGWVGSAEMPRVFNPPAGAVWSANNRQLGTELYQQMMGGDQTDHGARAGQIRDRLLSLTNARPADLLAIQLDDRALLLQPWQRLLLNTLERTTNQARFAEARGLVNDWGARAAVDSVGYRLVRGFRYRVLNRLIDPVVARCRAVNPHFDDLPGHLEGVAWDLLEQRPPHLLPPAFGSYDELLVDAARKTIDEFPASRALASCTWGDANRVQVRHPLGKAVPALSRWLDLPERRLPGDIDMPRVQGREFGASERLVVSPAHEDEGIFHMPGGQSGHFLSPFYSAGHRDWEEGRPTALLPGAPLHRLVLKP